MNWSAALTALVPPAVVTRTSTAPALPAGAVPLGLLCIGPVDRFYETPLLIQQQWRQARPVPALFTENNWAPSWNTDTSATTEQPLHS